MCIQPKGRAVLSLIGIFPGLCGEDPWEDNLLHRNTGHLARSSGGAVLCKVARLKPFHCQECLVTWNISLQCLKLGIQGGNANKLGNQKLIKLAEPLNVKNS